MFDRVRIDAAARIVQSDAGEQFNARVGEELLQDHRVRDAKIEVILVNERAEFGLGAVHQRLMMIENTRHRSRSRMAVQIDRTDQQARNLFRARLGLRGG